MSIIGETRKSELKRIESSLDEMRKIYDGDSKDFVVIGSIQNDFMNIASLYRDLNKMESKRVFATQEDIESYNIVKKLEREIRELNEKIGQVFYQKGICEERILV